MRADRLLSIMMLLQARRRMTAQDLADELEVSVRTIYRDIDALSAAGVPVYAERGPGGGCALLDSYRTTLTGLTADEVRALFMLSIPAPLAELGVDQELKAALLKLSASLPGSRRQDEERVRQRIHLDWSHQVGEQEPVPHLRTIQQALWQEYRLRLVYRLPFEAQLEWRVEPMGLVAQSGIWHLICRRSGHLRVLRVSRVLKARVLEESFERPADFDLVAHWQEWVTKVEANRPVYEVKVRVSPSLLPWLPQFFGQQARQAVAEAGSPDAQGWRILGLSFGHFDEARRQLLGFGGAIEVMEPQALRHSVADFARQTAARYADLGTIPARHRESDVDT